MPVRTGNGRGGRAYLCETPLAVGLIFPLIAVIGGASGCASARIPYPLEDIESLTRPRHPMRVAILPFDDARLPTEPPDADGRYVFRRREYLGTALENLAGRPVDRVTEVLARHLAKRRMFAQIVLVRDRSQAPDADLILSGKIRRLRGYVEAEPPPKDSGRRPNERMVLAEVVLKDLILRAPDGRPVLHADAGWSIFETRTVDPETDPPDPWAVMSEALRVAVADFVALVDGADLSGRFEARPEVTMAPPTATATATSPWADLGARAPYGWRATMESDGVPVGWDGARRCPQFSFRWRQTRRFNRTMGPYQPRVRLWACAKEASYAMDRTVDFPAELLGDGPGARYFLWALGETNWPRARQEVRAALGIVAPSSRYVFEVGPDRTDPFDVPSRRPPVGAHGLRVPLVPSSPPSGSEDE